MFFLQLKFLLLLTALQYTGGNTDSFMSFENSAARKNAPQGALAFVEERPLLEMEYWDKQLVGCWLLSNGGFFVDLVEKFHHNTINGALMLKLKESVLMREYGLSIHEAGIFLDRLANDKTVVKEEVNHIAKVDLARCDSKEEGVQSIVHEWSYEEVCLWLLSTGGEKLKLMNKFYGNQVNGTQLLLITADDLTAWGYPASDVKCFLWWRDYIAQNGYCFKDSFNKLFTRPRNKVSRDEPISDMDSVTDGSDTIPDNDSIISIDSNDTYDSDSYADELVVSGFNGKPKDTDGVDIVIGGKANVRTPRDVDIVLGGMEEKRTGREDIVIGGIKVDIPTKGQPDIVLSPVVNNDLCATDKPKTSGNATDGEIIQISPAPSRYDSYVEQNLKAIREAIAVDEHETAGKQTAGVIIQLSPAPSRHDLYAEQNLKAIREANHETPGEIQDQIQAEPGSPRSVHSNDQKQQTFQDEQIAVQKRQKEQNELQKQIESVQKIPNVIRAYRKQQNYRIDNQDESQNVDLSSPTRQEQNEFQKQIESVQKIPNVIRAHRKQQIYRIDSQDKSQNVQPESDCQFNVQIHEDLLPNIQTAIAQLSQNLTRIRNPTESKQLLQNHHQIPKRFDVQIQQDLQPNIQTAAVQLSQNLIRSRNRTGLKQLLQNNYQIKDQVQFQDDIRNDAILQIPEEKSQDESQMQLKHIPQGQLMRNTQKQAQLEDRFQSQIEQNQTQSFQNSQMRSFQSIQPQYREKYQISRDRQILDREKQSVQSIQPVLEKDRQEIFRSSTDLQESQMRIFQMTSAQPFELDRLQLNFRPMQLFLQTNDFSQEEQARDHDQLLMFQQIQMSPQQKQSQLMNSQELVAQVYLQSVFLMEQNYTNIQNQVEGTVWILIFIAYAAATSDQKESAPTLDGFGCVEMVLIA